MRLCGLIRSPCPQSQTPFGPLPSCLSNVPNGRMNVRLNLRRFFARAIRRGLTVTTVDAHERCKLTLYFDKRLRHGIHVGPMAEGVVSVQRQASSRYSSRALIGAATPRHRCIAQGGESRFAHFHKGPSVPRGDAHSVGLRLIDFEDAVPFGQVIWPDVVCILIVHLADGRYPFKSCDEDSDQLASAVQ